MTDELVLYTNPMSRGRIARWMVEEIGQPYRAEIVGFGAPMKSADYKAINPMGKVPTLVHGDTVVTECAAICAYLADAFPQAGLAPEADSRLRGPYYRWLFFAAGPIEAAVSNKAFGFEVPPERARSMGYGTFGDVMDTLEQAVSQGEYLLGDRFSAADVYVGAQILWGLQFGTIEKRPAFEAYGARLSGRPAARRADEIDNALMAEMQKKAD
ncbi:glutathione S-transferase family protein [Bosea sp. NBC_00550]|uniref:glutathione S-transferase family protein n=1 Tax=Bosea sp. NBC_00550 TaxID=2969621 RepID=UPI0022316566|nr:glutathione S-transferase family protein [Bosea sp. NBC_00550]UZF91517.1 glutathione S-transferase family protein [Bosea sp. NBC_00550]